MKKANMILSLVLLLSLSGCTDTVSGSSQTETTSAAITTAQTVTHKNKTTAPVYETFKAEVKGYKNGLLRFVYENQEYELPFDKRYFKNDVRSNCINEPCVSEMIINNRFGEKVFAKIATNDDKSSIISCDIITANGKLCESSMLYIGKESEDQDLYFTFKRQKGSLCQFKNDFDTYDLDLNDLINYYKYDYPSEIYPVTFKYYEFDSGNKMLVSFAYDMKKTDDGSLITDKNSEIQKALMNRTCFYGSVQSYDEESGKAVVLLNDKKTLCTVPTYYNDGGKLKEGAEIMITLMTDNSLFGSGGTHEFDYAVISTDRDYYMSSEENHSFNELAYAQYDGSIYEVKIVTVSRVQRQGDLK